MHCSPRSYISKLSYLLPILLFHINVLPTTGQDKPSSQSSRKERDAFKQNNFDNTKHRPRGNDHIDMPSKIPQEFVEDMLREYPEIANRIEILQDEEIPDLFIPSNLLLVGKGGCGKTTMAVAIAQTLKKRKFVYCHASSLIIDASQRARTALGKIMEEMERNPDTKYVIVVDDIFCLAEQNHHRNLAIARLWYLVDTYKYSTRLVFIATSNEIDELPEQIRSRFTTPGIIEATSPNPNYRRKILLNCLKKHHNLKNEELDNLVSYTEGLTHLHIEIIVRAAALNSPLKNREIITYDALIEALKEIKDISFIGRWIYDPTHKWILTPTKNLINSCRKLYSNK